MISRNLTSMKDIRIKYKPMVDLSKFASNKKILSGVVTLGYNQVYCSNNEHQFKHGVKC